jgi:thymidylate synthase ThyX
MPPRQIYLLSPKELSPETIAVAFAKTSRSPESFRQIAAELTDKASAKFHEKWVVGYGHASVAEHAVLHIAIENVSRLAVECLESNRLASYTEKSTRYQRWGPKDLFFQLTLPAVGEIEAERHYPKEGPEDFFIPSELDGHPVRKKNYLRTCRHLFDAYAKSLAPVRVLAKKLFPPLPDETGEAYDRRIRPQYVDACRFLLPASSLANLGMTANARVLEHAICKMLSHPLAEVRQIGEQVKQVAQGEVPTLVKYADALPYLTETAGDFEQVVFKHDPRKTGADGHKGKNDWCTLIDFDSDGENQILAAALYRFGERTCAEALETVTSASQEEREKLAKMLLGRLGPHDTPLRELEHSNYTFDLILDQGGYAEFKRHRMMTQTAQALTTRLGYALPRRIVEAGFEVQYRSAMQAAAEAYEKLAAWNPHVAAYVVPNGFNRRVLFTMNLREAYAFCQLRSAANAHFSMRRVAQRVAEEIRRVHPLLARYLDLPEETWQEIEAGYFAQT